MCTVTFIPVNNSCFITSNRDEKSTRRQAIPPEIYNNGNGRMMYPTDADAGGSWIALSEQGYAAVLLNGAFHKHESKPPYKKSRGIVFLEIVSSVEAVEKFRHTDLIGIEPFTMIIFDGKLVECRWDGLHKYCSRLQEKKPHIWSSSTLYTEAVVKKREEWFAAFLQKNPMPTQEEIVSFHRFTGDGDAHNDLMMNRNGLLCTVSVTGMALHSNYMNMQYHDLIDNNAYHLEFKPAAAIKQPGLI